MVRELARPLPPPPMPTRAPLRAAEEPVRSGAGEAAPVPRGAATARPVPATPPVPAVEQAVQLAASARFQGRAVEVQGFVDDRSGRFVYRVADRHSGEVLVQSPPEALLQFFASARAALGPFVQIEA